MELTVFKNALAYGYYFVSVARMNTYLSNTIQNISNFIEPVLRGLTLQSYEFWFLLYFVPLLTV